MNLAKIRENAWSYHPDEHPQGECIGEYVTDYDIFYYYGPDNDGKYRYITAGDLYYRKLRKNNKRRHLKKGLKEVINIYIDTDLKGLKGKAAYGYFLEWDRPGMDIQTREGFGFMEDTRNRVFLAAAIEALERVTRAEELHIYAPCQYVVESANKGMPEIWFLHEWMKGDKSEIKNRDLWERILPKLRELKPVWHDGKHAYSDVILRNIKERQNGLTGNRAGAPGRRQVWPNGTSPYHI